MRTKEKADIIAWKTAPGVFRRAAGIEMKGEIYVYGAVFIGMPEMNSARIETYQTINDNK